VRGFVKRRRIDSVCDTSRYGRRSEHAGRKLRHAQQPRSARVLAGIKPQQSNVAAHRRSAPKYWVSAICRLGVDLPLVILPYPGTCCTLLAPAKTQQTPIATRASSPASADPICLPRLEPIPNHWLAAVFKRFPPANRGTTMPHNTPSYVAIALAELRFAPVLRNARSAQDSPSQRRTISCRRCAPGPRQAGCQNAKESGRRHQSELLQARAQD